MRFSLLVILMLMLCGCTELFAPKPQSSQAEAMLYQGIEQLSEQGESTALEKLVETYPETPQAKAASQILKAMAEKDQQAAIKRLKLELNKLRDENDRLHQDLEKLRQLLIKLEKRAS